MKTVLKNLRHTNVVRFTCAKCNHHYEKTAPLMTVRFGEWQMLEELEARIVCSKCGNRAGNFISYGNPDR